MHGYFTNLLIRVEGLTNEQRDKRCITHVEADQVDQLSECKRDVLLLSLTYALAPMDNLIMAVSQKGSICSKDLGKAFPLNLLEKSLSSGVGGKERERTKERDIVDIIYHSGKFILLGFFFFFREK